ncbi:16S rRNA (cytidine(1402)-2'-O)-methyltransferase [Bacillus timonensis]|nr:16S rRNA (cytidine(1402)-2'-O)-methyltransferase [Bacillus timonensis]
MWQQKSYQNNSPGKGTLYLVPTPIGNLEDMTFRAVRMLKEVDLIAAEDTRQTKKLCNYFDIHTHVVSYHDHNKEVSGSRIILDLEEGKNIAIVSDAGMPTISDPGYELVVQALERNLYVVPLPGANAALTALTASGLPTDDFYFFGFLDRHKKEKRKQLEALKHRKESIIFYEAPHRLKETLRELEEIFGNRKISVSRELTKKFEEFIRGDISSVRKWADEDEIRGEFCLVIEGSAEDISEDEKNWWEDLTIIEHVNYYITEKEISSKDSIKQVSLDRGIPKRDVYQQYHIES